MRDSIKDWGRPALARTESGGGVPTPSSVLVLSATPTLVPAPTRSLHCESANAPTAATASCIDDPAQHHVLDVAPLSRTPTRDVWARAGWLARAALGAVVLTACEPNPSAPAPLPGDWRDRVFYQIVTDRFANGEPANDALDGVGPVPGDLARWQGGDWRGITEHLDYLAELGISAIWISPITRAIARMDVGDGYHGYWTADFTELEPRFGTEEELRELVVAAHARDIAVMIDVVPNHVGRVFAYDLDGDAIADPEEALPPYRDTPYDVPLIFTETPRLWTPGTDGAERFELVASHFHRRGVGDLGVSIERQWGDFPDGLRDLATEDDALADALAETYARWAVELELDGFRIDAVPHADLEFWRRFCAAVRARVAAAGRRDFFLLGEIFEGTPERLVPWVEPGSVDAGFDLPLAFGLIGRVVLGGEAPASATAFLQDTAREYPTDPQPGGIGLSPWQARVIPEGSHDLPRLRSVIDDPFAIDQALALVFTAGGIPLVYYGTEAELDGAGGHLGREPLWETGFRTDTPTFRLVALLAAVRRSSIALRRGDTHVLLASEVGGSDLDTTVADAGLLAFDRVTQDDRVLVVLATHPTRSARATIATGFAPGTVLSDRLGGEARLAVRDDGTIDVNIGPRTTWILRP